MLENFWVAFSSAFALGFLSSISPCPLATNIAAVSYIGKSFGRADKLLKSGFAYAFGRAVAYTVLAAILSLAVCSAQTVVQAVAMQIYFWSGPFLILLGMAFCGMFTMNLGFMTNERLEKVMKNAGIINSFLLGVLFALTFCPTSAAAFLALLGLCAKANSIILMPMIYGLATAIPVLVCAIILAITPQYLGSVFKIITKMDFWIRNIAGVIFIGLGIWFSLVYVWMR